MSAKLILEKYDIPDKPDFFATTSHKFKSDLFTFFTECKDKIFIEFGTSRGFSSVFVSELFKHVHTVNIQLTEETKELLSKTDNITAHKFDLYNSAAKDYLEKLDRGDVFFVDAKHEYKAVKSDTYLAKEFANKGAYVIYDDYGAYREIKRAVKKLIDLKVIEVVKYIGNKKGWKYGENDGSVKRTLEDYEGVICKIL